MAAITLPSDTGEFHVYDGSGNRIMDTRGGTVYIWGSVSILENIEVGGNINLHGVIEINGSGGGNSIWAHGNVLIEGTVTVNDTLTVNADTELAGDTDVTGVFTVYSGLSPVFVVNGSGATLTGKLIAGGITIDAGVMSLGSGSASITFSGGSIQVSGSIAVSGGISTSGALTVTGSAQLNAAATIAGSGFALGFFGSGGSGIQNVVVTGQTTDDKLDDLISALAAYHLITTS